MTTLMDNLDEYRTAFRRFAHGADKLPLHRLGHLLRYLGLNPTESEVEDLKNEIDGDQNGFIDMHEFVQMVQDQFAGMDNDEELLEILFSQIDTAGRGSMSLDEIRNAIEQCKSLVCDEKEQEKLRGMILTKNLNTNGEADMLDNDMGKIQRLKNWVKAKYQTLMDSSFMKNLLNPEAAAEEQQQLNRHSYNSPESRHNAKNRSESEESINNRRKEGVQEQEGDEPTGDDIWLSKEEIEEMVREFDVEGQGRFDTGAFIKAWRDLHAGGV